MAEYLTAADVTLLAPGVSDAVLEAWIVKAEARLAAELRQRGCSIVTLAADPDRLASIQDVLGNAVLRVIRNPHGLRSESEGDYSVTLNPVDASGNVWFPSSELDVLCARRARIGTVRLGLPAVRGWKH